MTKDSRRLLANGRERLLSDVPDLRPRVGGPIELDPAVAPLVVDPDAEPTRRGVVAAPIPLELGVLPAVRELRAHEGHPELVDLTRRIIHGHGPGAEDLEKALADRLGAAGGGEDDGRGEEGLEKVLHVSLLGRSLTCQCKCSEDLFPLAI